MIKDVCHQLGFYFLRVATQLQQNSPSELSSDGAELQQVYMLAFLSTGNDDAPPPLADVSDNSAAWEHTDSENAKTRGGSHDPVPNSALNNPPSGASSDSQPMRGEPCPIDRRQCCRLLPPRSTNMAKIIEFALLLSSTAPSRPSTGKQAKYLRAVNTHTYNFGWRMCYYVGSVKAGCFFAQRRRERERHVSNAGYREDTKHVFWFGSRAHL